MKKNLYGFTFVELIVVLVIIAILSTIGFTVYESYLSVGRDTKRVTQLRGVHQSLSTYATKTKLPYPTDKIDIMANGNTFAYQGNIDDSIANKIGFDGKLLDKEFDIYPTYMLGKNRKDFQLLNFIEDPETLLQSSVGGKTHAYIDYQLVHPKVIGKPLGIMLDEDSGEPLQIIPAITASGSFDVVTGTGSFTVYYADNEYFDTDDEGLNQIIPNKSCKRILEMGKGKGDGEYKISPTGSGSLNVYCDMRTDGGGWILISNYLHKSGTNPALTILTDSLPLQGKLGLGVDESGTLFWGHASNAFLNNFDFSEIKFYGKSSGHSRIVHFATSKCKEHFTTGVGNCSGINTDYNILPGHTAILPEGSGNGWSNQGDNALTYYPFYGGGNYWNTRGQNHWRMDDNASGSTNDTLHQIFIR